MSNYCLRGIKKSKHHTFTLFSTIKEIKADEKLYNLPERVHKTLQKSLERRR
jgi:hypothetical protein